MASVHDVATLLAFVQSRPDANVLGVILSVKALVQQGRLDCSLFHVQQMFSALFGQPMDRAWDAAEEWATSIENVLAASGVNLPRPTTCGPLHAVPHDLSG